MSIIVALFLVFLSLHSCNARVFKVARMPHAKDQLQHSINKENIDGKQLKHVLSEVEQKKRSVGNSVAEKGRKRENIVVRVIRESGSNKVSFRVPEKKGGDKDKDKDFFIDYTPPRTHPPSHN